MPAENSSANVDPTDLTHELFAAARDGDAARLRAYVATGLPIDVTDDKGNSLVMLAAYAGQLECLTALLEAHADVNILNDRGQSPIAGAVFKGHRDIVEALITAGANPDLGKPSAKESAIFFERHEYLPLLGIKASDVLSVEHMMTQLSVAASAMESIAGSPTATNAIPVVSPAKDISA